MPTEAYGTREASKSLADDPKALDWNEHVRRVAQDTALKTPRRMAGPDRSGTVRVLLDKVGK
jgi:hypothetical protein